MKNIFSQYKANSHDLTSFYIVKIEMRFYVIRTSCIYCYRKYFDNARDNAFIVRVLFGGRPLIQY